MKIIDLNTEIRTTVGNGPARTLRREEKLPAVLYGPDTEPIMLTVNISDIEVALRTVKSSQAIFHVKADGGKVEKTAMIKELQQHPLSGDLIHIDFYEIDKNRKVTTSVPVVTTGDCKGVELGGLLSIIRRELDVLCLPFDIPEAIEIDITDLDVGDSVHVEEIKLPEGVEIPTDVNFTVVTVVAPKVEAIEGEGEEGEEAEAAEGAAEEAAGEEGES